MNLEQLEQYLKTHQPVTGKTDVKHFWDERSLYAVVAAVAAGRPLLVRGEPGTGKTQLARAAAHLLNRRFIGVVVQPYLEAQDLLWSIDYTARLADAHHQSRVELPTAIDGTGNYLCAGPVWWAINAKSAATMKSHHHYRPEDGSDSDKDSVLLIDEIDKGDINIANSLLEVMAERGFEVPPLQDRVSVPADKCGPLIIFTSNDTRSLPAAFVRRCAVLHITLPSDLAAHLVKLGRERYPDITDSCLQKAAELICKDRSECRDLPRTGVAECMDLLKALHKLTFAEKDEKLRAASQQQWLDKIAVYNLKSGFTNL